MSEDIVDKWLADHGASKTDTESAKDQEGRKTGFVAIIGAPNAGKSTLVNRLVGAKVSIVTHKVQTTRMQVRGVVTKDLSQIVFVDTPGIFKPRRRLDRAMVSSAWSGASDADIVAFVVDAERGFKGDAGDILEKIGKLNHRKILLLNKVDRIQPEKLLALTAAAKDRADFEAVFMISALNGSGCDDVLQWLADEAPLGPWHYPEDQLSDLSVRLLAAEITREKLFLRLHKELPYSSHVETEKWEETDKGIRIDQVVYVQREAHKKMVIGASGATIKAIGAASRKDLIAVMEKPVHLFLFVKVREKWGDDPERYQSLGLEFPT